MEKKAIDEIVSRIESMESEAIKNMDTANKKGQSWRVIHFKAVASTALEMKCLLNFAISKSEIDKLSEPRVIPKKELSKLDLFCLAIFSFNLGASLCYLALHYSGGLK